MAKNVKVVMNVWSTVIIIFFTMILLLIFRPESYSVILDAIINVLKIIGDLIPNVSLT